MLIFRLTSDDFITGDHMKSAFSFVEIIATIVMATLLLACSHTPLNEDAASEQPAGRGWQVDFFDDFDSFDAGNWQDQMLWVNDEDQCYLPDNQFDTREVSDGTLKLRVVELGEKRPCDNLDKSLGHCGGGDWQSLMLVQEATLDEYHEYSVEWVGNDLIFRLDGSVVYRSAGQGEQFPEPMFAILNFAKINDSPMTAVWVMEVDWVKHEYRD